jgi:chemotaxis protein methyltransferase CheR
MAFTFFFRDMQILELIMERVVPDVMGRSNVKVWDAGCAMGQEVYSLAILFAEHMGHFAFKNLQIYATDIEEGNGFGETVRTGTYPEEDLQRVPADLHKKYFSPVNGGSHLQIADTVRNRITYRRHDLLSLEPVGSNFSLILCKNVLLHFQAAERVEVIKMFHRSLAPGGYFATEQTQKMPGELEHLFVKVAPHGQIFKKVEGS